MRIPKVAPEKCYDMITRLHSDAAELINLGGKLCDDARRAEQIIGELDYDGMEKDIERMYEIGLRELPALIERMEKRLEFVVELNKPIGPHKRPLLE